MMLNAKEAGAMSYTVPKLTEYSRPALDRAKRELLAALEEEERAVSDESEWKALRDRWMARKNGMLTQVNELWLKAAPKEAKRDVGQLVNEVKLLVEDSVSKAYAEVDAFVDVVGQPTRGGSVDHVKTLVAAKRFKSEKPLDITLPGIRRPIGAEHPTSNR
jgi:phenylalanyl-tRNA synthetase alpha chain